MTGPRAVLVGLPGAGKSTVGSRLAGLLGVRFADSDDLITARAGRTVTEIFAADGEPAFRAIEQSVIQQALSEFTGVLALGGGAVTSPVVRQALRDASCPVVLLVADPDELLRRVSLSATRPLLTGDTATKLAQLSADRAEFYDSVATMTVRTLRSSPLAVATELSAELIGQTA